MKSILNSMFLLLAGLLIANSFSEVPAETESSELNTGSDLKNVKQEDTAFHLFSFEIGASLGYGANVTAAGFNGMTVAQYCVFTSFSIVNLIR